jgi:hypothetical protein
MHHANKTIEKLKLKRRRRGRQLRHIPSQTAFFHAYVAMADQSICLVEDIEEDIPQQIEEVAKLNRLGSFKEGAIVLKTCYRATGISFPLLQSMPTCFSSKARTDFSKNFRTRLSMVLLTGQLSSKRLSVSFFNF